MLKLAKPDGRNYIEVSIAGGVMIVSLLLLLGSISEKPAEITWLQLDWPPHQIVEGTFTGEGTYDLLLSQIISKMPQFRHQVRLSNLQRVELAFNRGEKGICTMFGKLHTDERAKNRLFSKAMVVGSRLTIGFLRTELVNHPAITSNLVDIKLLVADGSLIGAYQPDRQYPEDIQRSIVAEKTNLVGHNFTSEVNAVALLKSGRIDYVLEYPERLNYFNRLMDEPTELLYRRITSENRSVYSYIACSDDVIGAQAIAAINQLLPQLWQDNAYLNAMRRWLVDSEWLALAEDVERVQQNIQDFARDK